MSTSPHDIVICSPIRSAIGAFQGGLSTIRPDDLLAQLLERLLEKTKIDPSLIDEVFIGCANQAGEDNRNIARMSTVLAGIPYTVPAVTVNRLCASGLEAVVQAYRAVRCGAGDVFIAGGVESMSRAPYVMPRSNVMPKVGNVTIFDTSLGWRFPNPEMEKQFALEAMGCTAENIVDEMQISRADQDQFALQSHQKAISAQNSGAFTAEITPINIAGAKGTVTIVDTDEGPRADTSLEKLAKLRPAFRTNGSVTAGNSSTLNDGASAMIICSREAANKYGLQPLARILSTASAGVHPSTMGYGPVPATQKALAHANLSITDIDLFEINEAFAAQSLGVMRKLGIAEEKVNVHGGAIALGHPLGCSGARILTTLTYALQRHDKRYGVASLCVGVGQGLSVIIQREDIC